VSFWTSQPLLNYLKKYYTGCLKIREFWIQSVVRKDPVELEKYLEKKIRLPEEDISTLILLYYSNYVAVLFLRKITKI
jgi:hypothetical protein